MALLWPSHSYRGKSVSSKPPALNNLKSVKSKSLIKYSNRHYSKNLKQMMLASTTCENNVFYCFC